jgi:2-(1,2-epoxy-1,2-dihydrophenyl)acetyl-CoA isomerase
MSSIKVNHQSSVAWISFNRPEVYNSFNREMALSFQAELDRCQADMNIRAVVISGEGKAFCAGQDLQEVIAEDGPELPKIVAEHYNPIIARIRNLRKPVIAAVNGVAAGAGANIALACDIVVAAESASFIQAFSKIGLIPDSAGTFFLPRLIGFQKASALMMLGDKVGATEAERMGMIYKAVEDENFKTEIENLANKLANMPTHGLWLTKQLLNESHSNNLEQQLNREGDLQTEAGNSYDYQEGVNAFLEKRKPVFRGN